MENKELADFEQQALRLKKQYVNFLSGLNDSVPHKKVELDTSALLRCQQLGNEYFNWVESAVGSSGLLGAHENGKWVIGFAETCHSVLDVYVDHILFLRSHSINMPVHIFEPGPFSFSNMQRMVKEYLPLKEAISLRKKFEDNNLPISGFTMNAPENIQKTSMWLQVTSISIGAVLVLIIMGVSFAYPVLTPWQGFLLRALLSLSLSALAATIPGLLFVKLKIAGMGSYFKVIAGGAIGIFVLIWFASPPPI